IDREKAKENIKEFLTGDTIEEEWKERPERLILPTKIIKPLRTQKLIIQQMQGAAEAYYFWILNFLRNENALAYQVEKTSDVFTATEASTYFSSIEQRKEAQMRNVSQYQATIGQLTKNLFQMIREMRVIDERRDYYEKSKKGDESAEVALKGIWTSMVEGGAENPSSVMGLSRKLGFVIVPDLFFKINPKKGSKGVDREVNALGDEGINVRVRSILKQKLMQYYLWKERTGQELKWRRTFILKSMATTYHSIKMYTHWLKPYLRNIRKLQMANIESPDLVTAFESSYIDLELFATKDKYEALTPMGNVERKYSKYFPCILVKFNYVTRPEMAFQQEYQHRGAMHSGRTTITIEGYVLTKDQLDQYRQKREDEDMELIQSVEDSVEALGDDMKKYLEEAGEFAKTGKEKKKKEKGMTEGILEPFTAIISGFKDILGGLKGIGPEKKVGGKKLSELESDQEMAAAKAVSAHVYVVYDVFKKSNGMLSW
ncbi:MAG: hypothetical protein KKA79_03045, partial [Nanoarchaeota archaeon]|nr:hypothetical protein [Nanoarchaeota archaeon]